MKTKFILVFVFLYNISQAQNTLIPDSNFENFLETRAADNSVVPIGDPNSLGDGVINGMVPTSKISGLTAINLFSQQIEDLTGIEDFSSLNILEARGNKITSIDVSMLPLTHLDLSSPLGSPGLSSINVASNAALTYLNLNNNSLMNIDVTSNTNLLSLLVGANNLTTLNVSQNTNLVELSCSNIGLTTIDLSVNTSLERLICSNSGIITLDLTNNTNLIKLFSHDNESLSSILLPNHPNLTELQCYMGVGKSSSLSSIDVSMCPNLETFWCYNNNITGTLDVSNNTKLVNFDCGENDITAINMPNDTDTLTRLLCDNNDISTLDISNNQVLDLVDCSDNPSLASINIPTTNTLTFLICNDTGLATLDISGLTGLENLWSFNNTSLTTINLPSTNTLNQILSSNTGVINFDASMLSGLEFLRLNSSNSLTSLALPNTTTLQTFWMYGHALSSIDFTPYTNLYSTLNYMDLGNGDLTSIDVSMLAGLLEFYCNDNTQLAYLNINNGNNASLGWMWADNTNLSCIQVDNKINADNKNTNNWRKDMTTSYEESCPSLNTEDFNKESIALYPNPTRDIIHLELYNNASYSIIDPLGKVVGIGELFNGKNEINLTNLTNGMYFLSVSSSYGNLTRKVLKK